MNDKRLIIFGILVFILMNIASYLDGDFFDWKMNVAFILLTIWIYINRKIKP